MGTSQSKHRGKSHKKGGVEAGDISAPGGLWMDMEGPNFSCAYLGFVPISKPPTGASVLQTPVKDLYFKYRRQSAGARTASLKLTQQGVLVALIEDGQIFKELFFEFSSVVFVEALKFTQIRGSSEKKPKAMFTPVDEGKPALPDKAAFSLDKNVHFLASTTHPPLVVCVVRRPSGVKALDCHVFALDTVENSLHIAGLIGSTQMPLTGGDANRKGSFERKSKNDVIRTEFGEYNVYRGGNYDIGIPSSNYDIGIQGGISGVYQAPGVNTASTPRAHGGMLLTQEDFHRPQMLTQEDFHRPQQTPQHQTSPYGIGGFTYDPQPQRPDILGQMSNIESSGEDPNNRSFGGSHDHIMRARETPRHSNGNRLSAGGMPPPVAAKPPTPRSLDVSPSMQYQPFNSKLSPRSPDVVQPPSRHMSPRNGMSPRSSTVISPTYQKENDFGNGSEIFSASNLESRGDDLAEEREEGEYNGRPVAKVPPHMKGGIKVLPSDFKAVKLKPKLSRESDSFDDADTNKDILMSKYKDLEEKDRVLVIENRRVNESGQKFRVDSSGNINPQRNSYDNSYQLSARNNNFENVSNINGNYNQSFYEEVTTRPDNTANDLSTKDAEIASMFADFRIHGGGRGNPLHKQQRNDFEQGLGYLP